MSSRCQSAVFGAFRNRVQAQLARGLGAPRFEAVGRALARAASVQHALRGVVQVLEQLRLPGIPDPRAGAADVGHRQQVQRRQAPVGSDPGGERRDDGRIGDVLLLRGRRHHQVLLDQPGDELGVLARKLVRAAESPRVGAAQRRMIAAAALGDIVKQSGEIEHFRPREVGDQPRAQRIFVRVLGLGEAAQIADHHQDVLVDGVDVEQVVLHLADDASEHRQIAAENAVLVHPPQLVRDAARLAQDLDEARAIGRVAAKCGIDAIAVAPQRAQRARRHALELRMLLQREEAVEYRGRPAGEQLLVDDVEQLVDGLKIRVDRLRGELGGKQPRMQVLQQHDADLADRLRRPVIALHQLLGRAPLGRVGQPEVAGERGLHVEHQPVLAAAGEIMQADAQVAQQPLLPDDLARLRTGHQAARGKIAPGTAEARGAGDPHDRLQIAQAARAFLDVGLEIVGGVLVAQVALLLLERLGFVKGASVDALPRCCGESAGRARASRRSADARAGWCGS